LNSTINGVNSLKVMKMQMICIADSNQEEFWGPYTDLALAERILKIVQSFDPVATLVSRPTDQWAKQIISGLRPWKIHIDVVNGELQFPATVSLTWPPMEVEGLQIGTPEFQEFFAWAKTEREALLNLARINKGATEQKAKAEAI
jgi:hypothetical protein